MRGRQSSRHLQAMRTTSPGGIGPRPILSRSVSPWVIHQLLEALRRAEWPALPPRDVVRIALEVADKDWPPRIPPASCTATCRPKTFPDTIRHDRVLDFGIAKLSADEAVPAGASTLPGVVLGTAGRPGAGAGIRGGVRIRRADLFALGRVLRDAHRSRALRACAHRRDARCHPARSPARCAR